MLPEKCKNVTEIDVVPSCWNQIPSRSQTSKQKIDEIEPFRMDLMSRSYCQHSVELLFQI